MNILIAEDDLDIADQYKSVLLQRNHNVTIVNDGKSCISKYDELENNPEHAPEVVVLDYMMPEMNGLQVAKHILEKNPKQRIIFASAYVEDTLTESIKELKQIVELIQKPFLIDTLADTIEDKEIFNQLEALNVDIKNLKDVEPTHAQIRDYLEILKTLQDKK